MTDDTRPDPDALLAQLRHQAQQNARGRLRIYFGASAGVGKTCAMLQAARRLAADGVDVLVGVVETHGRADTAALLAGMPVLPPALRDHRGRELAEFDIDGTLQRRPSLVLVDELAHTNVPGARHPKRWQDVEELLAAGIDVYGTLNVQHLESLNDVVGGITGITVQETVPDTFFDAATDVVLVDTPADELIARLAAGKVYVPEQAERAAKHFFRKGNLMALRELALRRTAERVEDDVQAYRTHRAITPVWKTGGTLLCCIGADPGAERVVRATAQLARQLAVDWHAVYVETPSLQRLGEGQRDRILRTVRLAQDLGADAAVIPARDVAQALVHHARQHNLARVVLGQPTLRRGVLLGWPRRSVGDAIGSLAPDIDRVEIGRAPRPVATPPARAAGHTAQGDVASLARRCLGAAAACLATALLAHQLTAFFDLANIVMVFLLSVVGVALWLGRGPAVLAAFLNVAAFDFFFVVPRLSFAVSDAQYLLTFLVMLVVGLVTGQLTAGLRFQAQVATQRETRSRALFEAARDLSAVLTTEQAIAVASAVVGREFRAAVAVYVTGPDDRLVPPAAGEGLDLGTAQWSLDQNQPAGLSTGTLAGSAWLYLPLKAPMRSRGVLAVRPENTRVLLLPEQRQHLETFAALTAMALERLHFSDVAQTATVQMASERLRNSLLAALSHDLRTPLSALVGMAETLAASQPPLSATQHEMASALSDRATNMADMVTNLLDMARIQSGEVRLRREWQSMQELVAGAVAAARAPLGTRPLHIHIDEDVPLVDCDAVLIERVLANLLENAGKYTPDGTPIEVIVRAGAGQVSVSVQDHGPGVPPGRDDAIFEKFTRGDPESATPGVGLGLAICRAIVEAHGGHIRVGATVPHGATFTFDLPSSPPPAVDVDENDALNLRGAA